MARLAVVAPKGRGLGSPGGAGKSSQPRLEDLLSEVTAVHSVEAISAEAPGLERLEDFDLALYEVGDEWPTYGRIYEAAARRPGLVLLLTPSLGGLVAPMAAAGSPAGTQAAAEAEARLAAGTVPVAWPAVDRPWCARLVRLSVGVLVTSRVDEAYLQAWGLLTPVRVLGEEDPASTALQAVEDCLSVLRDPLRKAVRRWAYALAFCGGRVDLLVKGYGAKFADALERIVADPG